MLRTSLKEEMVSNRKEMGIATFQQQGRIEDGCLIIMSAVIPFGSTSLLGMWAIRLRKILPGVDPIVQVLESLGNLGDSLIMVKKCQLDACTMHGQWERYKRRITSVA